MNKIISIIFVVLCFPGYPINQNDFTTELSHSHLQKKINSFSGTWDINNKTYDFSLYMSQTLDSIKGSYSYVSQNKIETNDSDASDGDKLYTLSGKVFIDSAFIIFYSDSPDELHAFDSAFLILNYNVLKLKWHRLSYQTESQTPGSAILIKEK